MLKCSNDCWLIQRVGVCSNNIFFANNSGHKQDIKGNSTTFIILIGSNNNTISMVSLTFNKIKSCLLYTSDAADEL
ncbi:MAG: hypothetical protein N5848_11080, partial [Lactobacillus crispatus]|nr:hypothetical protein [Lactobacillus crispatus]